MKVIRFDCPRCGKHLRVSPEKAGRHGRCPTCGGRIKVPKEASVELADEHLESRHVRLVIGVVVGLFLIGTVAFLIGRGEGNGGEDEGTQSAGQYEALVRKLEQVRRRLTQLDDLDARLADYKKMALAESELRARDVRRRLNAYEPVSVFECTLREQILAERGERRLGSPESGTASDKARLNASLTTLEREHLKQLSERLEQFSAELAGALQRANMPTRLTPDPLGRQLLNPAKTEERVERERELLRKEEADIRRQMLNPVGTRTPAAAGRGSSA